MKEKIAVAVIGPGNIGTDLMMKIRNSEYLKMAMMAGIVESEGIRRAADFGIPTTTDGIRGLLSRRKELSIRIVFDATSAKAHLIHAPLLREAGLTTIDLTPAAVGPYLVPSVNIRSLESEPNVNMVTCGGQATVPIVYAVSRVAGAEYAEIVSAISSKSAGPGTRANIDEFTETTAAALERIGGAKKGKAIIILNPAEPPIHMSNTVYVRISDQSEGIIDRIRASVDEIVRAIKQYVPGYELRVPPMLDGDKVTVGIRVRGAGDFLPEYSGNLDIMNAAAVTTAEHIARKMGGQNA